MVGSVGIKRRILLYEPSEAIGNDLSDYLGKEGFTVDHVSATQQTADWANRFWYRAIILGMETVHDSKGLDDVFGYLMKLPVDVPKILHMDTPNFLHEEMDQFRKKLKRSQQYVEITKKTRYDEILEHLVEIQRDPGRSYNDDLVILSGNDVLSITNIIGYLESDDRFDSSEFPSIQSELSDLLRLVFECQSIQIEKIRWHEHGKLEAQFCTHYRDRPEERVIGVISKSIQADSGNIVKPPVEIPTVIRPWKNNQTSHYFITTYKLDGDPDWSRLITITDLLQHDEWDEFNAAIKQFQDYVLQGWQKRHTKSTHKHNIAASIRQYLGLEKSDEVLRVFKNQIQRIVDSPPDGEIGVEKDGNFLEIHLPNNRPIRLPNPTFLVEELLRKKYPGNLIHIPCQVDLKRIVVAKNDHKVWTTSLDGQGTYPRFWAETDLELSIRRMVKGEYGILHDMEQKICNPKFKMEEEIPAEFFPFANCIQLIRQNSLMNFKEELNEYQALLSFKLLNNFCSLDLVAPRPSQDPYQILIALSHNLYALMNRGWIPWRREYDQITGLVEYDEANDQFLVDGRIFQIENLQGKLLKHLVENSNRPISYVEIAEKVLGLKKEYINNSVGSVKNNVQQIKSRLRLFLKKESRGFEYFELKYNKYIFRNPPIAMEKGKRKRPA